MLFLPVFGVELAVKIERKRVSRMWENVCLSIKNPKASSALKGISITVTHPKGVVTLSKTQAVWGGGEGDIWITMVYCCDSDQGI